MDNQNRKLELLGNAPIPKALLAMGIPTMIGMLINALYSLVDAYFGLSTLFQTNFFRLFFRYCTGV